MPKIESTIEDMTLPELFAEADRIGAKYTEPTELEMQEWLAGQPELAAMFAETDKIVDQIDNTLAEAKQAIAELKTVTQSLKRLAEKYPLL